METPRKRWGLIAWIVAVTAVTAIALGHSFKAAASSQTSVSEDNSVVLELFTSQGCSSCPPADALVSELGSSTKGVIPLAYHVDYWNHLGWSDPFSSRQWSDRQSAYARSMLSGTEYTPQMMIDGAWQAVGSDRRGITDAVAAARSTAALGRVSLRTNLGGSGSHKLEVRVNARMLQSAGTGPFVVMLAIYENGLVTKIGGGENSGRQIRYDYTVRKLLPAFRLDAAPGPSVEKPINIELDPSWSLAHLGVAGFIQDIASLRIVGAAAADLTS